MSTFHPHLTYTQLYDMMTAAHKRIAVVLVESQSEVYLGKKSAIFEGRELIAIKAKCSVSTVRDFIKKYEGFVMTHETRRKRGEQAHDSNLYFIDTDFYEAIICLKYMQWLHKRILDMSEDEHFLSRKVAKRHELSTSKLPTAIASKLPTIKSYIKSFSERGTLKGSTKPKAAEEKKGKAQEVMKDLPIPQDIKDKLELWHVPYALIEARKDYDWFKKHQPIYDPVAYFKSRIREHEKRRNL